MVIEKCALKIRKDSPTLLKELINKAKAVFIDTEDLDKKALFILEELDRIKLNKKLNSNFDEGLAFLKNWYFNVFIKKLILF